QDFETQSMPTGQATAHTGTRGGKKKRESERKEGERMGCIKVSGNIYKLNAGSKPRGGCGGVGWLWWCGCVWRCVCVVGIDLVVELCACACACACVCVCACVC